MVTVDNATASTSPGLRAVRLLLAAPVAFVLIVAATRADQTGWMRVVAAVLAATAVVAGIVGWRTDRVLRSASHSSDSSS